MTESTFLAALGQTNSTGFNPLDFLLDLREHEKDFREPPLSPSGEFTPKRLMSRPGMKWLGDVHLELVSPQTDDHQRELSDFLRKILDIAYPLHPDTFKHLPRGLNEKIVALDLETTGLDTRVRFDLDGNLIQPTKIVGVCLAVSDIRGYYLPVRHTEADGVPNWNPDEIVIFLDNLVGQAVTIYHNAQYDREVMALEGVTKLRPAPYFFCTQILHFAMDCVIGKTLVDVEIEGSEEDLRNLGFI